MPDRYWAGFFDADGCVRVAKAKAGHPFITAHVANCYLPAMHQFKERYGGSLHRMGRSSERHRRLYQIVLGSAIAARFLRAIQPYCIVKAEQISLALELQSSIEEWKFRLGNQHRKHPQRDAIMARRWEIAEKIKALKHERFDL